MATTSSTSARRGSAATDITVTDNTHESIDKKVELSSKEERFDDDEKTLSNFALNEGSSGDSKISSTMTDSKSKSKGKKTKAKKAPLPPDYYPNNLFTFMAISNSRI